MLLIMYVFQGKLIESKGRDSFRCYRMTVQNTLFFFSNSILVMYFNVNLGNQGSIHL